MCEQKDFPKERNFATCQVVLMPVRDALEVLSGKWKILILISLLNETKRFKQISRDLQTITDKILSKELKQLEENKLIKRTVKDTFPPTVEYNITEHGKTIEKVIGELAEWGKSHRQVVMGKVNSYED
ncbi:winged helix-turn-helix transcriptional regulator [Chondrinema litorale]|uniref:winged helix-turn-helix transcriptional regulator n=1 Tax=Chondrinema litorale TaxID=2994555 RepID=UPI002542E07C|nr:helix-turn-helix domain-containing protein [Chondrinema litorale]UZR95264.1 helix-turn-helix domain-containing protein [Chondrinema litorale]